jgi:succinate dehydrogenase/fumarate reductase-like Fe-S protein
VGASNGKGHFSSGGKYRSCLSPQGQPERYRRAVAMVAQANHETFGNCGNIGECEAVCPKDIKLEVIARMNRDFLKATVTGSRAGSLEGRH